MNPIPSGVKGHGAPPRIPYQFRPAPVGVPGLSPTELVVFTAILDDARRRSWRSRISNAALAAIVGRTTMTVKRCLAALEGRGLIAREFAAAGRIRLGIAVTWEGVEHPRSADARTVEHQGSGGGTSGFRGVEHSRSPIQSPPQSELPDAARSLSGGEEDAASRVASGPEAARYLRLCVEAGRRGEPMPPPPAPLEPSRTPQDATTPRPAPTAAPAVERLAAAKPAAPAARPYFLAPTVSADEVSAAVARMTRSLAEGLKAPDLGRRRVGPRKLAAQLAELRRRHGSGRG